MMPLDRRVVSFRRHIAPLFRREDIDAMEFLFDLRSYDEVVENADSILERLEGGSMLCDWRWPPTDVMWFRAWMEGGCAP